MEGNGLRAKVLASTGVAEGGIGEEMDLVQHSIPEREMSSGDDLDSAAEETGSSSDSDSDSDSKSSDSSFERGSRVTSSPQNTVTAAQDERSPRHVSSIFEAQLFPDGAGFLTSDYDRTLSVYAIDNDILNETGTRNLKPYAQTKRADPIWAFAVNPNFNVSDASTTHVLLSCRNQYITLHNALWDLSRSYDTADDQPPPPAPIDISTKLANYKLIDHIREAILAPLSLTYTPDATRFIAGIKDTIAVFDLEYTNDPIIRHRTIPSKNSKLKGGGRGFKGEITALTVSPPTAASASGVLAAGSRTRYIALYDAAGCGEQITHYPLPGALAEDRSACHGEERAGSTGAGVSQLKWSPCGMYLYVAERMSDAIVIYDVRNFGLALGHCAGRNAMTRQRVGFDVWAAGGGVGYGDGDGTGSHEVWGGGMDGKVRVWRDPHLKEGGVEASEVVEVGGAPVASTLVHPSGSIAVAALGCYEFGNEFGGEGVGRLRKIPRRPAFREWGRLDILGFTGC